MRGTPLSPREIEKTISRAVHRYTEAGLPFSYAFAAVGVNYGTTAEKVEAVYKQANDAAFEALAAPLRSLFEEAKTR